MCGRFTLTKSKAQARAWRKARKINGWPVKPRYNIAPGQDIPIIQNIDPQNMTPARWGMPLSSRVLGRSHKPLINVRLETLANRIKRDWQHCIIPADGFYEWRRDGQPFYFRMPDHALFAMAGVWQNTGARPCCAVITCPADDIVGPAHDRMPLILPADRLETWLTNNDTLMWSASADLVSCPVSMAVNKIQFDDPSLIEPYTPPPELNLDPA